MYCRKCGKPITSIATECPYCHEKVVENNLNPYRSEIYNRQNLYNNINNRHRNNSYNPLLNFITTILLIIAILITIKTFCDTTGFFGIDTGQDIGSLFGYSTKQIAKETQKMITDDWRSRGIYVTVLEDMTLVKKNGNEYSGMMKIMYQGKTVQLTGTVVYDGSYIHWQPDAQNLFYQLLY